MLIGIAGPIGAGKDTFGDYLVTHHSFLKESMALPIKQGLNTIFGWTMENWNDREWREKPVEGFGFSPREAAQKLGTEWRHAMGDPQLWCKLLGQRLILPMDKIVLTDIRFEHEVAWIKGYGGKIVYIFNPRAERRRQAHESEKGIHLSLCDFVFNNTSTLERYEKSFASYAEELLA